LVGVPSDVLRLVVGQELAGSRFATCLFLGLASGLASDLSADKEEIASQCERCQ